MLGLFSNGFCVPQVTWVLEVVLCSGDQGRIPGWQNEMYSFHETVGQVVGRGAGVAEAEDGGGEAHVKRDAEGFHYSGT